MKEFWCVCVGECSEHECGECNEHECGECNENEYACEHYKL